MICLEIPRYIYCMENVLNRLVLFLLYILNSTYRNNIKQTESYVF